MRLLLFFLVGMTLVAGPAFSQRDEALEAQATQIGRSLRCPVCQGQSIEESDAKLAQDMRKLVRQKLAAGNSEDEIIAWLAERYGKNIMLEPAKSGNSLFLWAAPIVILMIALGGGLVYLVRQHRTIDS